MPFFVALAVFSLDRLAKLAALGFLRAGDPVPIVPPILKLTLVLNDGAAFGLFKGGAPFFTLISAMVIIAISLYIVKNRPADRLISSALGLIIGGAAGNLADRLIIGRVVDFIDLGVWPVFNIADSCITIGTVMIIFMLLVRRPG
jgi:signal peptidase II